MIYVHSLDLLDEFDLLFLLSGTGNLKSIVVDSL